MDAKLEKQFENFFDYCKSQKFTKQQMQSICAPLIWRQRWKDAQILVCALSACLVICTIYNYCDSCAWFVSSIWRLLLIKLMPYAKTWETLYANAGCLIPREPIPIEQQPIEYENEQDNCVLCENTDFISVVDNISFLQLERFYMERGLPVIITNSHKPVKFVNLLSAMFEAKQFVTSEPCDVRTNLMLNKFFNLGTVLQKIETMPSDESWFLQLRNCKYQAVKSSRNFIKRPYYYAPHLMPFYSSWLLISHKHLSQSANELYLDGLIFLQQLSGEFEVQLTAKEPCECESLSLHLFAGQALIFSTDLWTMSYTETKNSDDIAVATIMEIDWTI